MFKNVMMYRMLSPWNVTVAQLEEALDPARFVACAGSQEKSVGWVEPRGVAHGPLVEVVGGQWILKIMVESKVLPASVVKRRAQEQIAQIEATTGRKPGKKERRGSLKRGIVAERSADGAGGAATDGDARGRKRRERE